MAALNASQALGHLPNSLLLLASLLLVVRPGAPSSVLAPSSDALVCSSSVLLLDFHWIRFRHRNVITLPSHHVVGLHS